MINLDQLIQTAETMEETGQVVDDTSLKEITEVIKQYKKIIENPTLQQYTICFCCKAAGTAIDKMLIGLNCLRNSWHRENKASDDFATPLGEIALADSMITALENAYKTPTNKAANTYVNGDTYQNLEKKYQDLQLKVAAHKQIIDRLTKENEELKTMILDGESTRSSFDFHTHTDYRNWF